MTHHARRFAADAEVYAYALAITAFRCAMAETTVGCEDFRIGGWEALERVAPPGEAVTLFEHFFGFVRVLRATAQGPLLWRPVACAHPCRDERLAIGMIDAAQRADVVSLLAAASQLLGVDGLGDALQAAQLLATFLARRGIFLCANQSGEACGAELRPRRTLH